MTDTGKLEQVKGIDFDSHINSFYYNPLTIATDYHIPIEDLINSLYNLYPTFYTDLDDVDKWLKSFSMIESSSLVIPEKSFCRNLLAFSVTMTNRHASNPKVCLKV